MGFNRGKQLLNRVTLENASKALLVPIEHQKTDKNPLYLSYFQLVFLRRVSGKKTLLYWKGGLPDLRMHACSVPLNWYSNSNYKLMIPFASGAIEISPAATEKKGNSKRTKLLILIYKKSFTKEKFRLDVKRPVFMGKIWIILRFCETAHLPLP